MQGRTDSSGRTNVQNLDRSYYAETGARQGHRHRKYTMVLPASNMRPPLQIRNEIKVPDSAQSVRFAVEGNIDGLKLLFSQGLAAPTAVSNTREFSLVRWALYGGMHNFETVKFLLNHGAFVDDE
ncbi:hypothetical protein EJ05DRAFT_270350 [Pseudovirgaria hyperparasitica]|uniref:Ankyrin n=1 Tax=Pseudovirgaria hyperparasitica TaxID=470096 RepID=A0A6A6VS95_9PEZI|nr:uncharacterized protein EJ05DRAFT_270350 [Pseudovirgaria hyperparasitica]KAF2752656.1 hypothetical protein EJ05DRAFT_270350 [Pseudovirgaria hyperparasitica]